MLFPYARRAPARPPCRLDAWRAGGFRLLEAHGLPVAAPPDQALAALDLVRVRDMPAARALFALRGLRASPDATLRTLFSDAPFAALEEAPGQEFVFGVQVPGPGHTGRSTRVTPEGFRAAMDAAPLAVVANFRAEPRDGGALLWTETWARAQGAVPRVLFGAYWLAIGPFSAWTRRIFLRTARARAEARAHLSSR
jgi:hypothetical protein